MWIAHKKAKYFTILDSGVKKWLYVMGISYKSPKTNIWNRIFAFLAIKSSLVDYKRNIFENINQIKVFCYS